MLARVVEAQWASLHDVARVRSNGDIACASGAPAPAARSEVFSWPVEPESTPVASSRSLSTVRNFLRAHELGFAVALPRGEGGTLVLWSDIRFCWDATAPGARKPDPSFSRPTGDKRIACALWFGGELDADGRPRLEVVKVGGLTQTRAPSTASASGAVGVSTNSTLAKGVPSPGAAHVDLKTEPREAGHPLCRRPEMKCLPPVAGEHGLRGVAGADRGKAPARRGVRLADQDGPAGVEKRGRGRQQLLLIGGRHHVKHVEEEHDARVARQVRRAHRLRRSPRPRPSAWRAIAATRGRVSMPTSRSNTRRRRPGWRPAFPRATTLRTRRATPA